jgi:hypothetical protein
MEDAVRRRTSKRESALTNADLLDQLCDLVAAKLAGRQSNHLSSKQVVADSSPVSGSKLSFEARKTP